MIEKKKKKNIEKEKTTTPSNLYAFIDHPIDNDIMYTHTYRVE